MWCSSPRQQPLRQSLNPIGRTGFREIAVALVASRLQTDTQLDSTMATLALVESAGEALVAIPLGSLCLLWYRSRWRAARATGAKTGTTGDDRRGDTTHDD